MNVHMDAEYIYLSMATYITNACKVLNIDNKGRSFKTPISQPIDTESPPLPIQEVKTFLTGLGMLGWLAQTVRPDVAYAYSRIGQHAANPTTSSMNAVSRAFHYLINNKYRCLRVLLFMSKIIPSPISPWHSNHNLVHGDSFVTPIKVAMPNNKTSEELKVGAWSPTTACPLCGHQKPHLYALLLPS